MPLGVVVRKSPGVTRWAKWVWRAVAVLPGAGPADGRVVARLGDAVETHAATVTLTLYRSETEAYRDALSAAVPSVYVVMRDDGQGPEVMLATASPYEAQDYLDSGEEIVEAIAMPPGLIAWVRDFTDAHHVDEPFKKRRRDRVRIDEKQDGKGDPRIAGDIYRAPKTSKAGS
ncbi:MAG: DUF3305 domain-containing protein [Pseudomonadota bacterium]